MESIKLYTNKTHRFGKKIIIEKTEITFDNKGMTVITESALAEKLLKDYGFVLEPVKEIEKVIPVTETKIESKDFEKFKNLAESKIKELENYILDLENQIIELKSKSEKIEDASKDSVEILEEIKGKTKKELQELCKSMEFEPKEYMYLKLEDLQSYITQKIK